MKEIIRDVVMDLPVKEIHLLLDLKEDVLKFKITPILLLLIKVIKHNFVD